MPISVSCQCGKQFQAPDRLAGKAVKCPSCGNPLAIPGSRESGPLGGLADLETAADLAQASSASGVGMESSTATSSGVGLGGSSLTMASPTKEGSPLQLPLILGGIIGVICLILVGILIFDPGETDEPLVADQGGPNQETPRAGPPVPEAGEPQESDRRPLEETTTVEPESRAASELPGTPRPEPRGGPPPDHVRRGRGDQGTRPAQPSKGETIATESSGEPPLGSTGPGSTGSTEEGTPSENPENANRAGKAKRKLPEGLLEWYSGSQRIPSHIPKGAEVPELQYGWMVELLPHLGHQADYDKFKFEKTWQHEPNAAIVQTVFPEFLNPLDNRKQYKGFRFPGLGLTHYVGMSGVEDGRNVTAAKLPRSDPRAGVFGYTEIAQRHHITDGTSKTIMLIGSGRLAGPWAINGGYTVRGARLSRNGSYFDRVTGFGSRGRRDRSAIILMADGSARWINADIDAKVFRAICTIHGGESVDLANVSPVRDRNRSQSFFLKPNPAKP